MEIKTTNGKKISFEIHDGYNYKFIDSYQKEYIVEFEQFRRIMKNLVETEADLITINDKLLSKRFIYLIEPTTELTDKQKTLQRQREEEVKKTGIRRDIIISLKESVRAEYMNEKYGYDNWTPMPFNTGGKHVLNEEDIQEIDRLFREQYPRESDEFDKLM